MRQARQAKEKSLIPWWRSRATEWTAMKRPLRSAIIFGVALAVAPFPPLFVEQTMTEVMFADGSGGAIEWGWKRCALSSFWSDYHYLRPQQDPALWLTVNVGLAFTYALAIALIFHLVFRNTTERRPQPDNPKK
jgi:hypothetical protein